MLSVEFHSMWALGSVAEAEQTAARRFREETQHNKEAVQKDLAQLHYIEVQSLCFAKGAMLPSSGQSRARDDSCQNSHIAARGMTCSCLNLKVACAYKEGRCHLKTWLVFTSSWRLTKN